MRSGRWTKAQSYAKKPMKFRVVNKPIDDTDHCVGQCWPNADDGNLIEIDPRQPPKEYMDTLLHEALHHLFPKKKEKIVLKAGTSLANLLWRLGYRRVKARKRGAAGKT